jgi:RNA polymerase sigma-70 factor (ECF subfamily)
MTTSDLQDCFQSLVDQHRKILYKICQVYGRDDSERDDLAQEIVLQLWRSFGGFDPGRRFSTWMYRIALNVAISFQRRERARTRREALAPAHLFEVSPDGDHLIEERAQMYRLIDAFDPLNKALMMLYLDGNSHRDIAEVLGLSETNVATKISRLKDRLKREFSVTAHE